jgi:hypothetical protein
MNVRAPPAPPTPSYKIVQRWIQKITERARPAAKTEVVPTTAAVKGTATAPAAKTPAVELEAEVEEVGDWFPVWFIAYESGDWVPHHTGYHWTPGDAKRHIDYLIPKDRNNGDPPPEGDPPPVLQVDHGAYKVSASEEPPPGATYGSKDLEDEARAFALEQSALAPSPPVDMPYLTFVPDGKGPVRLTAHKEPDEAFELVRVAAVKPPSPSPAWKRPRR